jgi:hypothetical protein
VVIFLIRRRLFLSVLLFFQQSSHFLPAVCFIYPNLMIRIDSLHEVNSDKRNHLPTYLPTSFLLQQRQRGLTPTIHDFFLQPRVSLQPCCHDRVERITIVLNGHCLLDLGALAATT